MSKKLYEEALADVKQVKKVAEENALRALAEAVTPRIREFIDQAILNEDAGEADEDLLGAVAPSEDASVDASAITPPDADGKVTLDIDSMCSTEPGVAVPPPTFGQPVPAEGEYEMSLESVDVLRPILAAAKRPEQVSARLDAWMSKLTERVDLLRGSSPAVRATRAFGKQIALMISRVDDMYDHVQESVADPNTKASYEATLEASFKALNRLQETTTMSKTNKGQMNEADVTLKLTGLPDDLDLDGVGVDLITGEEDGDGGAEGGEEGADAGLGDLDLDGGQTTDGEDSQMESTNRLSDDTIVEIDEGMLRQEIARMRALREDHTGTGGSETKADSWGNGPGGANILDDFGGGDDEGPAHDQEIADLSPSPGARPLGEQDDQDLEEGQDDLEEGQDDLDEQDDLDQLQNRRKGEEYGAAVADGHETATWDKRHEAATKRLAFEKRLQERAKARAKALKTEAAKARARGNGKRLAEIKNEYAVVTQRHNESVARATKVSKLVALAAKKLQESRSNSGAKRSAEAAAVKVLRNKLAETNLFSAKLLYTNKLLQTEGMSSRQKAQAIRQLEAAKTVRETKLVYQSVLSSLSVAPRKTVNEAADRKVIGSSSRTTRSAQSQSLNEGHEADRWAQLAGITKSR